MGNEVEQNNKLGEIDNKNSQAATIVSFHVGKPQEVAYGNKPVLTAIFKQPSDKTHRISFTGVEGDAQGDTVNHGGHDKAICVYLLPSYSYWQGLGRELRPGAFGENMTVSHWTEENVYIGDVYSVGELVVQVSQPRQPCFKLGIRNEWPELVQLSRESGYTGFYFRVLEEGEAAQGMEVKLVRRAEDSLSIKEANAIMYGKDSTAQQLERLASIDALADAWKTSIQKKISRLKSDQ